MTNVNAAIEHIRMAADKYRIGSITQGERDAALNVARGTLGLPPIEFANLEPCQQLCLRCAACRKWMFGRGDNWPVLEAKNESA